MKIFPKISLPTLHGGSAPHRDSANRDSVNYGSSMGVRPNCYMYRMMWSAGLGSLAMRPPLGNAWSLVGRGVRVLNLEFL